jgi:hypothetical protein
MRHPLPSPNRSAFPDTWSVLVAFASRLGVSLTRGCLDDETRRECGTHIELITEWNIRAGMTPEEA